MASVGYEVRDRVAELTLARPERLNAFDTAMLRDARAAVADATADADVRALLLTGTGRGFCAGMDLTMAERPRDGESVGAMIRRGMEDDLNPLVLDLAEARMPVVVAVNGLAVGGGMGLALAGDVVVAARSAAFVQVFAPRLGVAPDTGSSWFLPRLVGRARARGLTLLGDRIDAETAAAWGLVWSVVDDDALLATARGIADRLAAAPAEALRTTRALLDAATARTLSEALDAEAVANGLLADRPAFLEGVTAFLEKREPRFADLGDD